MVEVTFGEEKILALFPFLACSAPASLFPVNYALGIMGIPTVVSIRTLSVVDQVGAGVLGLARLLVERCTDQ
jgi:hypothetical protein